MHFIKDLSFLLLRSFVYKQTGKILQKKAVLIYLKTLQTFRKTLAGSLFLFVFLQLMLVGLVGALVVGVFLLPQELETKLWILLSVFLLFFILPFFTLLILFSEKIWFQASGAEKMVSDLNK
jgi:hypothetical protein